MIDRKAFSFVPGNITGLFQQLNGAAMYDILDTLDALLKEKNFYPNFNTYRRELDSAGIFVQRMEVAMSAVMAKNASRQTGTTWEKFEEVQDIKLRQLPADQQRNIKDYWAAGPTPGLQPGTVPVAPSIANVSWDKYVDMYTECKYDVNYAVPANASFYFSPILQLKYQDGTSLELDIDKDFSEQKLSATAARDAMAQGKLGKNGRLFPTHLVSRTVPRLWVARLDALRLREMAYKNFEQLAVTGTSFILTVPAMPAGAVAEEAAIVATKVTRRPVPGVPRVAATAAPIQGNMVRLGSPGEAGNLYASIQATRQGVVYRVDMIVLEGEGAGVATARATHREMIRRSAQAAQSAGQNQFKMVGKQANPNFRAHADRLAQEVGVPGSGKSVGSGPGYSDYEITLDAAKVLAQ